MFREFNSVKEITDYLVSPYDKPLREVANKELGKYVLPLFASELTENPENMMFVMTLYALETNDIKSITNFCHFVHLFIINSLFITF